MRVIEHEEMMSAVIAAATGNWKRGAALWLLDEHRIWPERLASMGVLRRRGPGSVIMDWNMLGNCLYAERDPLGGRPVGTGSERQVLALALGISGGESAHIDLSSVDDTNMRMCLFAIAWSGRGRDYARSLSIYAG